MLNFGRYPQKNHCLITWQKIPSRIMLYQFPASRQILCTKASKATCPPIISHHTWRIIPVSKWLVTPIYKPFSPFGRGTTLLRGLTNHCYYPLTNWDDPPSKTAAKWKMDQQVIFSQKWMIVTLAKMKQMLQHDIRYMSYIYRCIIY